jgi:hypothetical protein
LLDERPTEPVPADWMLAAFLLLRRELLDELGSFDEQFRLYGETSSSVTEPPRPAGRAGTCPRPGSRTATPPRSTEGC